MKNKVLILNFFNVTYRDRPLWLFGFYTFRMVISLYFFTFFQTNALQAQNLFAGYEKFFQEPRTYVVAKTSEHLTIDGRADETSWNDAPWSDDFVDIEGDNKPLPHFNTRMKMLWNDSCLFIFTEMEEPHVWAYFDKRDQIVYHENDFEVFLDPDGDTHNYFEFEVNALNTLFDLFLTRPYQDGGVPLISWNAQDFISAVSINGTLNDPGDTDKNWTIEIAIPFRCLSLGLKDNTPVNGQIWKVNFSRVQWKTTVSDGKYRKVTDEKTAKPLREDNWVWSPTGEINLHVPERWGLLQFADRPINQELPAFSIPKEENLKKYLWLIYYKQEAQKINQGKYALTLSEIGMPDNVLTIEGEKIVLAMKATTAQFTAYLKTKAGKIFSVNNQGFITEMKEVNSHE